MSIEGNEVVIGIRAETGQVRGELREIEYIVYRLTSMFQKMGLPPEVDKIITAYQKLILVIRMLHTSMMFLQYGTPYGLILGAISGISAGLSFLSYADVM